MGFNHLTIKWRACLPLTDWWGPLWLPPGRMVEFWLRLVSPFRGTRIPILSRWASATRSLSEAIPTCHVFCIERVSRAARTFFLCCDKRTLVKEGKQVPRHSWSDPNPNLGRGVQEQAKAGPKAMASMGLCYDNRTPLRFRTKQIRERLESVTSKLQPPHKIQLPCGRVASQSLIWSNMSWWGPPGRRYPVITQNEGHPGTPTEKRASWPSTEWKVLRNPRLEASEWHGMSIPDIEQHERIHCWVKLCSCMQTTGTLAARIFQEF